MESRILFDIGLIAIIVLVLCLIVFNGLFLSKNKEHTLFKVLICLSIFVRVLILKI